MADAIAVHTPTLHHMAQNSISLVHAFAASPVERLTWIVLVVADTRDLGYCDESIREVVKDAGAEGDGLAGFRVGW